MGAATAWFQPRCCQHIVSSLRAELT